VKNLHTSFIKFLKTVFVIQVNIVITLVIVITAETITSFFVERSGDHIERDYRINHRWTKNSTSTHKEWIGNNPDFQEPYVHKYNNQGWIEDYDIQKSKRPNTYRIFYLGDSFTEGTVPMDLSVPSVVENRLNKLGREKNLSFEVINTGTSSYSPTIFYVLTRYVLMDYAPDLIVVNIDLTDDFDDWKYKQTLILDNDGNPWAVPPRDIYKAAYIDTIKGAVKPNAFMKLELFLVQHSYIYTFLRKFFSPENIDSGAQDIHTNHINTQVYQRWGWCKTEWDDNTTANVNHTLGLLRRLARFCQKNNVKIMFTSVPHYKNYAGNRKDAGTPAWSSRPHYAIEKVAAEQDVPYLNSFEKLTPFISGTPQHTYYYKNDMHFNPRGYRIWADAHLDFLVKKENGLLPETFYSTD
jgi:lysophospholipase L1-like esterase